MRAQSAVHRHHAGSPSCTAGGASQCTVAFTETGAAADWTVPQGVTTATVTVDGAQGGAAPALIPPDQPQQPGGMGATVVATIPVTAGDSYQVVAGSGGQQSRQGSDGGGGGGYYGGGGGGGGSDYATPAAGRGDQPAARRVRGVVQQRLHSERQHL